MDKKWYNKKITKRDLKHCREFLKVFDVYCRFNKYLGGLEDERHIQVYTNKGKNEKTTLREFWSTIFHELCHVLCARERVYKTYHLEWKDHKNKKVNRIIRRCALRAELYVDKRAERLMRVFLPDIPYKRAYRSKEEKQWLKDYMTKAHPL